MPVTIAGHTFDLLSPLRDFTTAWITTPYGAGTAAGPGKGDPHYGIDIAYKGIGGAPVRAMGAGTVLQPNAAPGGGTAGNTVTIDYGNGLIALAGHLNEMYVQPGDKVKAGQYIGTVGKTGISTGTHLHLETWIDGQHVNPLDLFPWTGERPEGESFDPVDRIIASWETITTAQPAANGSCPTGFIRGNEIETTVSDTAGGAVPIIGTIISSISNWLPGGTDPNLCYNRDETVALFFQNAQDVPQASDLPFADVAAAAVDFLGTLTDPETWARILAIIGGAIMVGIGFRMVWESTGGAPVTTE